MASGPQFVLSVDPGGFNSLLKIMAEQIELTQKKVEMCNIKIERVDKEIENTKT